MTRCRHNFALFLALLVNATIVLAGTSTRTIDDQKGDSVTGLVPIFGGAWNLGPQCTGCRVQPSPSQAFGGTWHDTTVHQGDPVRTMTAKFNGTAVNVYGILAHTLEWITTFTNVTFQLDGEFAGAFTNLPTSTTDYQYNVLMYSSKNLANTEHTLVMTNTGENNASLVLFDYIQYTFEDPPTPTTLPPTTLPSPPPAPPSTNLASVLSSILMPPTSINSLSAISQKQLSSTSGPSSSSQGSSPAPSTDSSTFTTKAASTSNISAQPTTTIALNTQPASPHNSSTAVGPIAGGVAGGVVLLILIAALLCYMRRRRRAGGANNTLHSAFPGHYFGSSAGGASRTQSPLLDTQSGTDSGPSSSLSALPLPSAEWRRGVEARRSRLADVPVSVTSQNSSLPMRPGPLSPLAVSIPTMHFNTPPRTLIESTDDIKVEPENSVQPQLATAPPPPSAFRPPSMLETPTSRSPSVTTGVTTLRNQVVMLQEEIERLREEQELQRLLAEAPPVYVP